jgi:hypothetical protein
MKILIKSIFHSSISSPYLCPNIPLTPCFQTRGVFVPPTMRQAKFHAHETTGTIILLYILILMSLDNRRENDSELTVILNR